MQLPKRRAASNQPDDARKDWPPLVGIVGLTEPPCGKDMRVGTSDALLNLFEEGPLLIWLHDDARGVLVNRRYLTLTGQQSAELQNNGWRSILHPDDVDAYLSAYAESYAARKDFAADVRIAIAGGGYAWLRSLCMPRFTHDGAFWGYVGYSWVVRVESGGSGKASEFVVTLPLPESGEVAAGETEHERNGAPALGRALNILIAGDAEDVSERLALILLVQGHQVCSACGADAALRVAAERRPEIIIVDLSVTGANGCDIAIGIRQKQWGKNTLMIALARWGGTQLIRRAMRSGFDECLSKPLKLHRLFEILNRRGSA